MDISLGREQGELVTRTRARRRCADYDNRNAAAEMHDLEAAIVAGSQKAAIVHSGPADDLESRHRRAGAAARRRAGGHRLSDLHQPSRAAHRPDEPTSYPGHLPMKPVCGGRTLSIDDIDRILWSSRAASLAGFGHPGIRMGVVGGSRIKIKIEPDSNPLGLELNIVTLDRRNQDDTYPFRTARETVSGIVVLYIATLQALNLAVAPVSECVTQRWHVRFPGKLASPLVMPRATLSPHPRYRPSWPRARPWDAARLPWCRVWSGAPFPRPVRHRAG